jgi:hypothetical protein
MADYAMKIDYAAILRALKAEKPLWSEEPLFVPLTERDKTELS